MKKARVALLGGMGYPLTETPWGLPALKTKLEALGAETIIVNWSERQAVYNFMHHYDGVRLYFGDSLGAGSAAQYPGDVDGWVDYVGGFQPSDYDARSHKGLITVAKNCKRGHAIYDPLWIQTGGLGHSQYEKAFGATTIIMNTAHYGAHPDDWGWSQTTLYNEAAEILK